MFSLFLVPFLLQPTSGHRSTFPDNTWANQPQNTPPLPRLFSTEPIVELSYATILFESLPLPGASPPPLSPAPLL